MFRKKSNKNRPLLKKITFRLLKYVAVFFILSLLLVLPLRWINPPTSAFMIRYRVSAWYHEVKGAALHFDWVKWEQISPNASLAVLASEDQKFLDHNGFDYESHQ